MAQGSEKDAETSCTMGKSGQWNVTGTQDRWVSCFITHELCPHLDTSLVSSPCGQLRRTLEFSKRALRTELTRDSREPRPTTLGFQLTIQSHYFFSLGKKPWGRTVGRSKVASSQYLWDGRSSHPVCKNGEAEKENCPTKRGWSSSIIEPKMLEKREIQRDWRFPRSFLRGSGFEHGEVWRICWSVWEGSRRV